MTGLFALLTWGSPIRWCVTGVGRLVFPAQANGSLVVDEAARSIGSA